MLYQMLYHVFKAYKGEAELINTFEDKMDAARFEDELRKVLRRIDPDGAVLDCYTRSSEELERIRANAERWDQLTEEQKHEFIEVDGKTYVKAIWEANHKEVQ